MLPSLAPGDYGLSGYRYASGTKNQSKLVFAISDVSHFFEAHYNIHQSLKYLTVKEHHSNCIRHKTLTCKTHHMPLLSFPTPEFCECSRHRSPSRKHILSVCPCHVRTTGSDPELYRACQHPCPVSDGSPTSGKVLMSPMYLALPSSCQQD